MKKLAIKRVGLIGNSEKVSCGSFIAKAARLVARTGRKVCCDESTARMTGVKSCVYPDMKSLSRDVDLLLVFGGDGTMLRVASEIAGSRTPVLGINIGGLGFLTAVSASELHWALREVWAGNFVVESRPLIEVSGRCCEKSVRKLALNDFVISRGLVSRLILLEVTVDREPLTRYRCDGLIVSSPTGSTAYSLSAGGAVVHPTANVFAVTPICPHTLSNRSVIVSLDSKIHVRALNPKSDTILSADGQAVSEMATGDEVVIRRSPDSVRLVHLNGTSFFETLRAKLQWSGTNV